MHALDVASGALARRETGGRKVAQVAQVGLIPEDKIAEVRDRTDIVQVIGEFVSLKKSGVNHKGLCPFHGEKTPSFNVHPVKQMFHCFGCGKSGDVITFLMEMEGKSFIEVVRDLARRNGIALPEREESSPAQRQARERNEMERSRLVRANQLAAEYFRAEYASVRGARARAYVDKRGITKPVVDGFQLGYAPPGWDNLVRFFEQKKVPHEVAERAGLVKARDNVKLAPGAPPTKATHFDLFRDRVMCPVVNLHNEVVGFSGRLLEGEGPKYLNTPETAVFKKGVELFGLHVAKAGMRKTGRAILVEGNFDVLAMHVHGFTETVAPMGTALTSQQAHLLHRFAPAKVYTFLDGDAAGLRAAARNVGVFLDEDLLCFVALLPRGDDPDTFLRKLGHDAVELLLKNARESVEYFCDHAWSQAGTSDIEKIKLAEDEAAPMIRRVKNPAARDRYAQRLALQLGLPVDIIQRSIRTGRSGASEPPPELQPAIARSSDFSPEAAGAPAVDKNVDKSAEKPKLSTTDAELVALIADKPQIAMRIGALGVLKHVQNDSLKRALEELPRRAGSATFDVRALTDAVDPQLRAQVTAAAMSGRFADVADGERVLRDIVRKCEKASRDRRAVELDQEIAAARTAGDLTRVHELVARKQELNQERLGIAPEAKGREA